MLLLKLYSSYIWRSSSGWSHFPLVFFLYLSKVQITFWGKLVFWCTASTRTYDVKLFSRVHFLTDFHRLHNNTTLVSWTDNLDLSLNNTKICYSMNFTHRRTPFHFEYNVRDTILSFSLISLWLAWILFSALL